MPGSAGQCSNIWGWMTPPTRNTSSRTGAATQQAKPCLHTCRGGYPCATSTTGSSCRARRESGELQASSKAAAAGCLWAHRPACILPATRAWLHPESLAPQQQQRRHAGNINYCSVVESLSTTPSPTLCRSHMQHCLSGDSEAGCTVQADPQALQDRCGHARPLARRSLRFTG